jgi:hypothetical protein
MNPTVVQRMPFYCETGHPWLGMAEPVNTITNAAILIAAWLAYRYIKRSGIRLSNDLKLLLFLLVWVGIGSALWHGLRTGWALTLDWLPGVLFLLVLTVLWIRQLYGWFAGVFGMVLMLAASIAGVGYFGKALAEITPNLRFAPFYLTVTVVGIAMVAGTWVKYGRPAALHSISILCAGIVAAVARSIDLLVCPFVPTGTHFLWHIGLSTAACLGILLMVKVKKIRAGVA